MRCSGIALATLLLLVAAPRDTVVAQASTCAAFRAPVPAGDRLWCDTDTVPRLFDLSLAAVAPRYPDLLRSAFVEGEVVAEMTVTEGGVVDMASVRFVQSSHDLFTNAVKSAIRNWRFVPALAGGRFVRARGTARVEFVLPKGDSLPVVAIAEPVHQVPNGIAIRLGWRVPPRATDVQTDTARLYALIERIVRDFASTDTLRARCLEWSPAGRGEDAPASVITYLREHGVPRLPMSKCPPMYGGMIQYVDARGRPIPERPHGPNPHVVTINELVPWTSEQYVFAVWEGTGNGARIQRCQADWRIESRTWSVYCGSLKVVVF